MLTAYLLIQLFGIVFLLPIIVAIVVARKSIDARRHRRCLDEFDRRASLTLDEFYAEKEAVGDAFPFHNLR